MPPGPDRFKVRHLAGEHSSASRHPGLGKDVKLGCTNWKISGWFPSQIGCLETRIYIQDIYIFYIYKNIVYILYIYISRNIKHVFFGYCKRRVYSMELYINVQRHLHLCLQRGI